MPEEIYQQPPSIQPEAPTVISSQPVPPAPVAPPPSSHRLRFVIIAVLILLLFIAGWYFLMPRQTTTPQATETPVAQASPTIVVSPSPTPVAPTSIPDWQTYQTDPSFTFQYPPEAKVTNDGTQTTIAINDGILQITNSPEALGLIPVKQYAFSIGGVSTVKLYTTENQGVYKTIKNPDGTDLSFTFNLPDDPEEAVTIDKTFDQILSTFRFLTEGTVSE